jgi:hypothetical protein
MSARGEIGDPYRVMDITCPVSQAAPGWTGTAEPVVRYREMGTDAEIAESVCLSAVLVVLVEQWPL